MGKWLHELNEVDHNELVPFLAYAELYSFGPARDELHAGLICSTVHNMAGQQAEKSLPPLNWQPEAKAILDKQKQKRHKGQGGAVTKEMMAGMFGARVKKNGN